MRIRIILTGFALVCGCAVWAQEKGILTYEQYMENVKNGNMGYLAERYQVDIADANVKAARVFADPELSVSYGNNQNWNLYMGYSVEAELAYTLELGGKRKARIRVAQSEKEIAGALLEDYFRNLRADATLAYLTVLKQKRLYEIQKSSYQQMRRLAEADSVRLLLGDITEVDARQSKLEAASLLNCVYASEGDWRDALSQLSLFQGDRGMALPDSIAGELVYVKREVQLSSLIIAALYNRADLQVALHGQTAAEYNRQLVQANRAIDLGVSLGGVYASEVKNEIAPAPAYRGITVGVSVPLRFSNGNKGGKRAAELAIRRAEAQYVAVELQIKNEVLQAFTKYQVACRRVELYDSGLLAEAEAIFEKRAYSYRRGETSVLELLNARRVFNDIQIEYVEVLYECAAAFVEVGRSSPLSPSF
jgi:cobalt-zinc-cadmium efflux system outer membrane protein